MLENKKEAHERFWRGEGPCLILMPTCLAETYDTEGYPARFADPRLMWEAEMRRARPLIDWPTDGIPTVRPNLGVVFVPAIVGQDYIVREGQMPWPGAPLSEDAIRAVRGVDVRGAELMQRAEAFYAIHADSGETEVVAYHPDTQGVLDNAHLLYGNAIFCDAIDPARQEWMSELLDICLDLYLRVSRYLKRLLGETQSAMVHPHAGARASEDTAILYSPETIRDLILPYVERSVAPFGGGFAHFCGRNEALFEQLCRSPLIRAIDLQPGMHATRWLLERCAESGTALYGRIPAEPGEDWRTHTHRLGRLIQETGARCILSPEVFPDTRDECAAMRDLWHDLTA